jgi:hypothetical protein
MNRQEQRDRRVLALMLKEALHGAQTPLKVVYRRKGRMHICHHPLSSGLSKQENSGYTFLYNPRDNMLYLNFRRGCRRKKFEYSSRETLELLSEVCKEGFNPDTLTLNVLYTITSTRLGVKR